MDFQKDIYRVESLEITQLYSCNSYVNSKNNVHLNVKIIFNSTYLK